MQVVILAAGKGRRMGVLTKNTPKPLIKVFKKPLIDYVFEALPDKVDEYIVVIGYLGFQIKSHIETFYNKKEFIMWNRNI